MCLLRLGETTFFAYSQESFAVLALRIRPKSPHNALNSQTAHPFIFKKVITDNSLRRYRSPYNDLREMKEFLMLAFRIHLTPVAAVLLILLQMKLNSSENKMLVNVEKRLVYEVKPMTDIMVL